MISLSPHIISLPPRVISLPPQNDLLATTIELKTSVQWQPPHTNHVTIACVWERDTGEQGQRGPPAAAGAQADSGLRLSRGENKIYGLKPISMIQNFGLSQVCQLNHF